MCKGGIQFFSHCLIMGRPYNWTDFRSPKCKFRDISFVDTDTLINPWKFHVDPLRTVVTALSQIYLKAGSFDLTWWPNLRWPWATIFRKGAERMHEKVCKKRRHCAPPCFRCPPKTWWGAFRRPPPSPARVNHAYNTRNYFWLLSKNVFITLEMIWL